MPCPLCLPGAALRACLALCACLALTGAAAVPNSFVALPPELGVKAPARLVFSAADLAQCWNDATARRCVLRAPIRVDEPTWRMLFASTGGVAVQDSALPPFVITSEPCSLSGGCLDTAPSSNAAERLLHSQQQVLDLNQVPGVMAVGANTTLSLVNLRLNHIAYKTSFTPSQAQRYRTEGIGTGLWPSVQFAPDSKIIVANASVTFTSPPRTSCAEYVARSLFTFQQVYGFDNITAVNATANRVVGPVYIVVKVRDRVTDQELGNSTSVYTNVTFLCMQSPHGQSPGLSPSALAAAVAVSTGVGMLAGGLLLSWLLKWSKQKQGASGVSGKGPSPSSSAAKDVEMGGFPPAGAPPPSDASRLCDQGVSPAVEAAGSMPISYGGSSILWSSPSGYTAATAQSSVDADALTAINSTPSMQSAQPPHSLQQQQPLYAAALAGPGSSIRRGVGASSGAGERSRRLSWHLSVPNREDPLHVLQGASSAPMQDGPAHLMRGAATPDNSCSTRPASVASGRRNSGSTAEPGTPKHSLDMQLLPPTVGSSSGGTVADDRRSAVFTLLKQRSDVAVLRDLTIGPLLGRGSYGKFYRGRWKATTVAVKIIEHYGVEAQASSGGRRISAARQLLFATSISHPNVVTVFHISTMTISQRSALAKTWLADISMTEGADEGQDDTGGDDQAGDPSHSDSGSDSGGMPPDLLETWAVMEYCEKGSLERAMKLGKFKRKTDGQPDMVGIYKALLDTASGLDYLHSIGVVHGDLKTANVLLKGSTRDARSMTCKITDFGLSKVLASENQTHISTSTYGTIVYMPKELLLSGRMTQATDIYSFGLIMWELFCGRQVMDEGLSIGQMFYLIAYQDWRPEVPAGCPPGFAELMTACWHKDPEQRPTAQQLLRSLQKLYVQAKQQELAVRKGVPGTAQRAAAAALAPGRPSEDSTASEPAAVGSPGAISSPLRVSLEMDAAAVLLSGQQQLTHPAAGQERFQVQQPQHCSSLPAPLGGVLFSAQPAAVGSTSSSEQASGSTGRPWRSADSHGTAAEEDPYEPFVHAVLHRGTSLAVPARNSQTHSPTPHVAAVAVAAAAAVFAQQAEAQAASSAAVSCPSAPAAPAPGAPDAGDLQLPAWLAEAHAAAEHTVVPQPLLQVKWKAGCVQLLPGGAYLDPSSYPAQPLAHAEVVVADEDHHSCSEDPDQHSAGLYSDGFHSGFLHSDTHLPTYTNSSNAMYSEGTYRDAYPEQSGGDFFEVTQEPAASSQRPHHSYLDLQAQQQQQQAPAVRCWPSIMDILPLPPWAPDFSATQAYMDAIEWANRPEVEAAAAAAAARNLQQMRADAEAAGKLHLLPSFVRDPWLLSPLPAGAQRYEGGDDFAGCLPEFPDPNLPEGRDRMVLYLHVLDSARTPQQLIDATHAIIADAVAVDAADESGSSLAERGYAAVEPDTAVLVDSLVMSYGPSAGAPQQGSFPAQLAASLEQGRQQLFAMVPGPTATAGGGARAAGASGSRGGSSSANMLSDRSSNSTAAQRSSHHGSTAGGGATCSSHLYGPAALHSLPQGQAQHTAAGGQPDGGSQGLMSRVQPASLSGPLRSFAGGADAGPGAAAGVLAQHSLAVANDAAAASSRWSVVPETWQHADPGPNTTVAALSSGSLAAWAVSEADASVGVLEVVDEGGGGSDGQEVESW